MILDGTALTGRISTERIDLRCPPAALLDAAAGTDDPVLLDSSALSEDFGRYSVLTCCPLEVLSLREGRLTDRAGNILARDDQTVWRRLEQAFGCVEARNSRCARAGAYGPGWYGYLGYELGRHVERLPGRASRDTHFPDLRLGFHDAALVYDAVAKQWSLVELNFDGHVKGAGRAAAALRGIVASAGKGADEPYPAAVESAKAGAMPVCPAESNFSPEQYKRAVAKCVDYIAAGDIFQVNLSQRFTVTGAGRPLAIYRALRRRNPAWYAAFLSFEAAGASCAVLSCSPELFLRVRGRDVTTRPIKGTRRRTGDPAEDRTAAADLLESPKDNAELAMIVDLLRNDLGRVCRYGTVIVAEARRLETHPTIFHLVATVTGTLREDVGPAKLIRATFPGGSITGAPKIRAMEIIDELEPVARGVYTGCVGYVGVNGAAEWNIAIRTMACQGDVAHVQAGGGIVADSTPEGEYAETLDKARAMLEAIAEAQRGETV